MEAEIVLVVCRIRSYYPMSTSIVWKLSAGHSEREVGTEKWITNRGPGFGKGDMFSC